MPIARRRCDRCNALARKSGDIDAARDDPQACLVRAIAPGDEITGVERVGDDAIAACHDAVVEVLDPVTLAVGAVKGRDEGDGGASCGGKPAPCRRAARHIDERNLARANEARQAANVGDHGRRVLARNRHRHDLAAGGADFAGKAPALGCDECTSAGPYDCLGDLDRADLGTATFELRYDLEYGEQGGH
jgi:hypothetical protein